MKTTFFYIAGGGWTLSLIVHLCSLQDIDLKTTFPWIWALDIGLFVVWFAAIALLRQDPAFNRLRSGPFVNRINPLVSLRLFFGRAPKWLIVLAVGSMGYAMLNFLLCVQILQGHIFSVNGQHFLTLTNNNTRILSSTEYAHRRAVEIRLSSGHWMAFYAMASAVLYPFPPKASGVTS